MHKNGESYKLGFPSPATYGISSEPQSNLVQELSSDSEKCSAQVRNTSFLAGILLYLASKMGTNKPCHQGFHHILLNCFNDVTASFLILSYLPEMQYRTNTMATGQYIYIFFLKRGNFKVIPAKTG